MGNMINRIRDLFQKKDCSVQGNFEKEFGTEEYEMLVLIKGNGNGARVIEDMLKPSVDYLASVDLRTGELRQEPGRIEWLVKYDKERRDWGYDFKQYGIYRVTVRKCIPQTLERFQNPIINNRYMLVKVLQEEASNEALENLQTHYRKPVTIQNELGEFVLDRDFSWFRGCVDWNGEKATVCLTTDEENGDTASKAMETLKKLVENITEYDMEYRKFAAKELTSLANDWQEESDEEETEEITEESFAQRMKISEIMIDANGTLSVYYQDDEMFLGHSIQVLIDEDGQIDSADIVG